MKPRMSAAVRLATVLVVVVMAASVSITVRTDRDARIQSEAEWTAEAAEVQSLQIIDLDHDGVRDLFVQTPSAYRVFSASGLELFSGGLMPPVSTTLGDVDRDGSEDLVVFHGGGVVEAVSDGGTLWSVTLAEVGGAARSRVVQFASGPQVVIGDAGGHLVALAGRDGSELWRASLSQRAEVRGLDDIVIDGDRLLAAIDRAGTVRAFADDGTMVWEHEATPLRRMRTFDLDGDGRSEVYLGSDDGSVRAHDADGAALWSRRVGQTVVEIRDGELDGDPSSRELVAGGRQGGVYALTSGGEARWSRSIGGRVSDIATVDIDGDGVDEVVVGREGGGVTVLTAPDGARYDLEGLDGAVSVVHAGSLGAGDRLAVSSGRSVQLLRVERVEAPFYYTPIVAGLLVSVAIAGMALFIGGLPERGRMRVTVTDTSPEGLLARRRMLHENVADVEELRARGEIDGSAALTKLQRLRLQLAETEEALSRAGVAAPATTSKCPNCSGRVRLGQDKCDYCGEVVIA